MTRHSLVSLLSVNCRWVSQPWVSQRVSLLRWLFIHWLSAKCQCVHESSALSSEMITHWWVIVSEWEWVSEFWVDGLSVVKIFASMWMSEWATLNRRGKEGGVCAFGWGIHWWSEHTRGISEYRYMKCRWVRQSGSHQWMGVFFSR